VTLTPTQTATLTVTFTPTTAGSASGSVSVSSNATNSPAVISLSGSSYYVALNWTVSSSTDVVSYNVYRGTALGSYTRLNTTPVMTEQYSDTTVEANTYYYVVTAVDSSGVESAYSSPATVTVQ
jgi:fibronectin type 3 domain-containing protein